VALVGVEHLGVDAERLQGPDAADAEQDLLAEAVLDVTAVEAVGDEPQLVGGSPGTSVSSRYSGVRPTSARHTWAARVWRAGELDPAPGRRRTG
jgi:hypothetical protein